jgi:hypothetical protein
MSELQSVVASVCCLLLASSVCLAATEPDWQWRVSDHTQRITFLLTPVESGTDSFGSPRFSCERGSGRIEVSGEMDEQIRELVADLIRRGAYPSVEIPSHVSDGAAILPSHNDMDGWTYTIDMTAETPAFDEFKRTGTFRFKIGAEMMSVSSGVTEGLQNFERFRSACKAPVRAR